MRRYKEYQNAQLVEKIERETAKARAVVAAKEELRADRRATNRVLTLQRERLKTEMEAATAARMRRSDRPGSARAGAGARAGSAPPRPRSAMA